MGKKQYDFTYVTLNHCWGPHEHNYGGFGLLWGAKGIGFGTLSFVIREKAVPSEEDLEKEHLVWSCDIGAQKPAVITCDNEMMSRDFVEQALKHWLKGVKFDDE